MADFIPGPWELAVVTPKSSDPLVSKEQLRDIALAVHDTVHGAEPEPLEIGQIMVALMQLRNIYEAERRDEDGPNQQA
jgi:hypothetical protein